MELISGSDIDLAWRSALKSGVDPYLHKAELRDFLIDSEQEQIGIRASIEHLQTLKKEHPDFFTSFDYGWSFQEEAYWFGIEANNQARALQQLCTYWDGCKAEQIKPFPVDSVVLRKTFTTRFDLATPSYIHSNQYHFISIPSGFHEISLFLMSIVEAVALGESAKNNVAAWKRVVSKEWTPSESDTPPAILLEAIASVISDTAKDWNPHELDSREIISQEVDYFRQEGPRLNEMELSDFIKDSSFVLLDYAIAHELAHRMRCDESIDFLKDLDGYLQQEKEADFRAFELYASSWGYRSELLDGSPFEEPGRILLGPMMFFIFTSLRWALLHSILTRRIDIYKNHDWAERLAREKIVFEVERKRAWAVTDLFKHYAVYIKKRGFSLSNKDADQLKQLSLQTQNCVRVIHQTVATIPQTDFQKACDIVDHYSPTF